MKFERGKNPIEVLEIGMEEELQKFLQRIHQISDKRHHQLLYAVLFGRTDFVEYLLSKGITPNQEMLRIAINREWADIIKILLKENPDLKKGLYISKYRMDKKNPEVKKLIS
jgi:ankyrin repeat protein